ncbi:MAG: DUF3783 domain-containing protein [Oscillospiraceae bacterium]|nr:DUF3783 domain-containing protein [Oscillospiraceae bacterium]
MKSRIIPTLPETVLSYGIGEKAEALDRVAGALDITHKIISEDQAGEQVGFLAGYEGFSSNGSKITAQGECVIFSGIDRDRLDVVLKAMRGEGLKIPLKAVVTPSNQSQTVVWLLEELAKEHEAMAKMGRR